MIEASNHSLTECAKCETMAFIHKIMGLTAQRKPTDDAPWNAAGKAIHAARLQHLQGTVIPDCMALFEKHYREYATITNQTGKYSFANIERLLEVFLTNTAGWVAQHECLAKEWKFSLPLIDNVRFIGFIDAILARLDTKVAFPYELKSRGSASEWWSKKWLTAPQPTGYYIALHDMWTDYQVGDTLVEVLYLDELKRGSRKCRIHGVSYDDCATLHVNHERFPAQRHAPDMQLWWEESKSAARRLWLLQETWLTQDFKVYNRNVRRNGIFTEACMFCDCVSFCRLGRPWERLEEFFVPRITRLEEEDNA